MKSIVQKDEGCFLCQNPNTQTHHIFGGANRKNSDKYGLTVKLCQEHHTGNHGVHFNQTLMDYLHVVGQTKFEEHFPDEDFREIFGKNYL